jgi:hypothetical protein
LPGLGSLALGVVVAAVVVVAVVALGVVTGGVLVVGVLVTVPEVEVCEVPPECPPEGGLQFCSGSTYWLSPADPPQPEASAAAGTLTLNAAASAIAKRMSRGPRTAASKAGATRQGRARAPRRPLRRGCTRRAEPANRRRIP